jgi:hypothetical protein
MSLITKNLNKITNIFKKEFPCIRVKRSIPLNLITGVTVSKYGNEFVIHVDSEYDYRFVCK